MVCNASAGVSGSRCVKAVLPNLFRFRSHLQSIAAFPFTWLWLYGRCDIVQHLVFVVRPRYFLYFIHCMLSALQQILLQSSKYDLDTDSASQYFVCQHKRYFKRGKKSLFTSQSRLRLNGEFCSLHKYSCCWLKDCGSYDEYRVGSVNESTVLKQWNTSCYI